MAAPVININTAGAFGLTSIDAATATTNWAGFKISGGATPAPAVETDITDPLVPNAISTKLSGAGTDKGLWADNGSGVDMTVAGRHLYVWVNTSTPALCATIAGNGIYVIASTSGATATDYVAFNVGGSGYTLLGFTRYCIDLNKTPSRSAGTTNLASVQYFGAGISVTGTILSNNLQVGRVDYGDGLQIQAGDATDPATWAALADDDRTNGYGVFTRQPSGDYGVQGGITIGDPAATVATLWDDQSGSKVAFLNPLYHNGVALVSSIDAPNLYKIEVVSNPAGTDVDFGAVVGSGDDRQGISGGTIGTAGPKWEFDAETGITYVGVMNLYGVSFQGAGNIKLSGSTKTDCIGCSFNECDEIQPNDAEFLNNTIIAPQPDRGLEILSTHNTKQITFVAGGTADRDVDICWQVKGAGTIPVDYTSEANDTTANNVIPFPAVEVNGDFFLIGSRQKFSKIRINTGTAGVSAPSFSWFYHDGVGFTNLTGLSDGTTSFTTTGLQDVTFNVPTDWTVYSVKDEDPRFYIFAQILGTYTTNPLVTSVFIADPVEHHLHAPAVSTISLDTFNFFGFGAAGAPKWMGENSSAGLVTLNVSNSAPAITAGETEETGAGSTTVNNTVTVTFTNLVNGSEVRCYIVSTGVEEDGIETVVGGQFAASLVSGISYNVVVVNLGSIPIRREAVSFTSSLSVNYNQQTDPNYSND